ARLGGSVDVGIHDAHYAVVQQYLDVLVVDAADSSDRCNTATERGLRDMRDRLQVEDRVLTIYENEVMTARLRDARYFTRACEPHVHAERHLPRLHHFLQGIGKNRIGHLLLHYLDAVPPSIVAGYECRVSGVECPLVVLDPPHFTLYTP